MDPSKYTWARERVAYWWDHAFKQLGVPPTRDDPKVHFNYRFTVKAGRAWYHKHLVELSVLYLEKESQETFDQTIGHEVAHLVTWVVYGLTGHGATWKHVMIKMGLQPKRCHTYERLVPKRQYRKAPRFNYVCACGKQIPISQHRMTKMGKGKRYRCVTCNSLVAV